MSKAGLNAQSPEKIKALETEKFSATVGKADQPTAEAGTDDTQWMSSLATKQSITSDVNIVKQQAEQKLKDNAVLYLDFTKDEGWSHNDLAVTRGKATDLITYTCSTTATGQTLDGRIVEVAPDTPRLVGRDGESLGLLNEPSATNYAWPSEQFDSTSTNWGYFGAGNVTATKVSKYTPLGSGVATELNKTVADDSRLGVIVSDGDAQSGDLRTVSIYAAVGTANIIRINWVHFNGGVAKSVVTEFDTASESFLLDPPDAVLLHFEKIDSEWYRVFVTAEIADSANTSMRLDVTCGINETGTIFVDGAMVNDGYPTSYIPTTTTSVVRGVTITKVQKTLPESLSFFCDFELLDTSQDSYICGAATANNSDALVARISGGILQLYLVAGGSLIAVSGSGQVSSGRHKIILQKIEGEVELWLDGSLYRNYSGFNFSTTPDIAYINSEDFSVLSSLYCTCREYVVSSTVESAEAIALTTLEP